MKLKHLFGAVAALAFCAAGVAVAQNTLITAPLLTNVSPTDLFHDLQNGNISAQNTYVTAQQMNGVIGYLDLGNAATGLTQAFGNSTQEIIARSSATIAAITLTASPLPGDGQLNCYFNISATTAITWSAASGQSILNAPTAGVANTKYCMIYEKASTTWLRAQ